MQKAVLITGADGGIGAELVNSFYLNQWYVIAITESNKDVKNAHATITCDLAQLASDKQYYKTFLKAVNSSCQGKCELTAIINNAAAQMLSNLAEINLNDWENSFKVNLTAPLLLAQGFLATLKENNGIIINIGSVHAKATKPKFVTYATTKAALSGLTRAMAVDLEGVVRVVCLAPAAVSTSMLMAGFQDNKEAINALSEAHPSKRIASPKEISDITVKLTQENFSFMNGTTIYVDGGILSRLHDPI